MANPRKSTSPMLIQLKRPAAPGRSALQRSWAELCALQVSRKSKIPLFHQVYRHLRSAIASRTLRRGTKLPPTRELAQQLGISRSVAVSAYEQLLAEGYVSGKVGAGTYVSPDLPEPIEWQRRLSRQQRASRVGVDEQPGVGDFIDVTRQGDERPFNLGRTLVDARTIDLWRRLAARTFRVIDRAHLGYSDPRGLPGLRRSICDYLQAARAVRCDPEQIVVTAGTQQAIDILVRLLPAREAWIEDPGYPLTQQVLVAAGVKVCPVPVDPHGINVAAGLKKSPRACAAFVTPSHQFPTGVVLSMARRLDLLAWAREVGAWIVEDDYASEFRYAGRPLASLQGLDEHERVVYIGTLNKALFPGLRLGYAVVPRTLLRRFTATRYLMDRQPSSVCQAMVQRFMEEGHFASHIRRMRLLYRAQRDELVASLRRYLPVELDVDPPDQGMHLVAYLHRGLSDVSIDRRSSEYGVVVRAMSPLYVKAAARSALMLGFSGYSKRTIGPAVARLLRACQDERASRRSA
jgi:GntR family transcriptional regulator / MocR family aminotransferase